MKHGGVGRGHAWRYAAMLALLLVRPLPGVAQAESGEPIAMQWTEGDFAGNTTIWTEDGKRVQGYIAYRQHRKGDRLHIERNAYFRDGSRDVDTAVVLVGSHLRSISGRSIVTDTRNSPILDFRIDVATRRITGFYTEEGERVDVDEEVALDPATYWGPMFNIIVKNFAANASAGVVTFQAVLATPKPRLLDMELSREGTATLRRTGGTSTADKLTLLPTINFLVDPIIQRIAPKTYFFLDSGSPPSLARFDGPRNYAGQRMWLE